MIAGAALLPALLAACGGSSSGGGGGSSSSGAASGGTVKIGVVDSLTGPQSVSGLIIQKGLQLAADDANAKGGIDIGGTKMKVQLLFEDDQGTVPNGLAAAQKLITRDKVNFLIGDAFSSDVTLAVMPLAKQYNIPIMSAASASLAIGQKVASDPASYANFWKGGISTSDEGAQVVPFYDQLLKSGELKAPNKTVAFLGENDSFGQTVVSAAEDYFKQSGWKVVGTPQLFPLGTTNFQSYYATIATTKPDVLLTVTTTQSSGVAMVQQFHQSGLTSSFYAVYYPTLPGFVDALGSQATGILYNPVGWSPEVIPAQATFGEEFTKAYPDTQPTANAAGAYDDMNLILSALTAAGSLDTAKITAAMAATHFEGLEGLYVFDQTNHSIKAGDDFYPVPTGEILDGGKTALLAPVKYAKDKYAPAPWQK